MQIQFYVNLYGILAVLLLTSLHWSCSKPPPDSPSKPQPAVLPEISFSQSSESVEAYDFVEVTINVARPNAKNPCTEVFVTGRFGLGQTNQVNRLAVDGFCDSADGSVFRIRFMPIEPGSYV